MCVKEVLDVSVGVLILFEKVLNPMIGLDHFSQISRTITFIQSAGQVKLVRVLD